MSDVVYLVVERSPVSDSVLGVFSTIEQARDRLPAFGSEHFDDYRIECHVVDHPTEVYRPWQVAVDREAGLQAVEPAVTCSCCDEEESLAKASFLEQGGRRMQLIVWARTRGQAGEAGGRYRDWLLERDGWGAELTMLPVVHTEPAPTA